MGSDEWVARKDRYYQTHEMVCSRCGTGQSIHLHHLSYERMGDELNDDLMPLCVGCHDRVHELHRKVGGSLRAATLRAVAGGR